MRWVMSRLPADTVGGRSSKLNLGVEGGGRPPVILATAGSAIGSAPGWSARWGASGSAEW
jgi:hypothetical protein